VGRWRRQGWRRRRTGRRHGLPGTQRHRFAFIAAALDRASLDVEDLVLEDGDPGEFAEVPTVAMTHPAMVIVQRRLPVVGLTAPATVNHVVIEHFSLLLQTVGMH